jgi:hypothetical protein
MSDDYRDIFDDMELIRLVWLDIFTVLNPTDEMFKDRKKLIAALKKLNTPFISSEIERDLENRFFQL